MKIPAIKRWVRADHAGSNIFPSDLQDGLNYLFEASEYSRLTSCDRWEFAVDLQELLRIGVTYNDVRLLLKHGFISHGREISATDDRKRRFRNTESLRLASNSCFVLTKRGEKQTNLAMHGKLPTGTGSDHADFKREIPTWKPDVRKLFASGKVVKQFSWHAVNQETVLSAFQEEEWPAMIFDPLPPKAELDPKRRLHDTIKCLNRNQKHRLIRFRGDGTGEGVRWEFVDTA